MSRKKIIILSMLLLIILITVVFIAMSSLEKINIKGNTYYSDNALKEQLFNGITGENTVLAYLKLKYGKEPSIPFIDGVDVEFTGLHSLSIEIYEKEIIGCLPYMGEYVCFDNDGIMVGSTLKKRGGVPLVTGIEYGEVVFNKKIAAQSKEMFDIIMNITQLVRKYGLKIDRIDFDKMYVTLFHKNVKVLLGKRKHFDEQISNLKELLPKTEGLKGTLHMEEYSESNKRVIFEGNA